MNTYSNPQSRSRRRKRRLIFRYFIKSMLYIILLLVIFISNKVGKVEQINNYYPVESYYVSTEESIEPELEFMTFKVTHYCGCSKCCGIYSSGSESDAIGCKGDKLTPYYSIAADPNILPYGTICYDKEGNEYRVEDVGGAIKGYHIDLFVGDHQLALHEGVKTLELTW